jgi:hypothetical protein
MPAGVRPKGKATKIKEQVMGPMINQPKKKKKLKSAQVDERLAYEESSRVK